MSSFTPRRLAAAIALPAFATAIVFGFNGSASAAPTTPANAPVVIKVPVFTTATCDNRDATVFLPTASAHAFYDTPSGKSTGNVTFTVAPGETPKTFSENTETGFVFVGGASQLPFQLKNDLDLTTCGSSGSSTPTATPTVTPTATVTPTTPVKTPTKPTVKVSKSIAPATATSFKKTSAAVVVHVSATPGPTWTAGPVEGGDGRAAVAQHDSLDWLLAALAIFAAGVALSFRRTRASIGAFVYSFGANKH